MGDALGTYLEFGPSHEPENHLRDYAEGESFRLLAGSWADNTSMAFVMVDSPLMQRENWTPKHDGLLVGLVSPWSPFFNRGML